MKLQVKNTFFEIMDTRADKGEMRRSSSDSSLLTPGSQSAEPASMHQIPQGVGYMLRLEHVSQDKSWMFMSELPDDIENESCHPWPDVAQLQHIQRGVHKPPASSRAQSNESTRATSITPENHEDIECGSSSPRAVEQHFERICDGTDLEGAACQFQQHKEGWSKGSVLHGTGGCKPCLWLHTIRGCKFSSECEFCHLDSHKSAPRASKRKRDSVKRRAWKQYTANLAEGTASCSS
eukprot:gnl/TRDRNA2_/TRDRNA2_74228_c0_seq1.p1 gnl/TRDRNA2_/TRDRNA2_74228_c0~~gnl/TRDRNA2_/TRDRNA2_74228_c0_seq1.p1  ORF type:complete len:236 (+),score=44.33 gnl/TRDRNA2_/TRDRNA2_74228_c0_seq1:51-758(+)